MCITNEQLRDPEEIKRTLFNIKRYSRLEGVKRLEEAEKIKNTNDYDDELDYSFYAVKLREAKPINIFREMIVFLMVEYWNKHEGFYGFNLTANKYCGLNSLGSTSFICNCSSGAWGGHKFHFDYKDAVKGKVRGCTKCESKYSDGQYEAEHKKKVESVNKNGHKLKLLNYVQDDVGALYHCGDCERDFYQRPMYLKECVLCANDAEDAKWDKRHSEYMTYISTYRPELTLKHGQLVHRYYERFVHYCSSCETESSFVANSILNGNGKCKTCRANKKKLKLGIAKLKQLKQLKGLKPIIYNLKPIKKVSPIKVVTVKYAVSLNSPGYVYAIRHEWLPEKVKVGATTTTPKNRSRSIQYGGTLPIPFEVIASAKVSSAMIAERIVHHELVEYHIGGEWFCCSDNDIKTAFSLVD